MGAHTFTISGAAASTTGATTLTIDKPNANATINDGTLVHDPAVTAGDVGRNVFGTGIQMGATVLSVTPGQSFVMSLPATQKNVGNAAVTLATPDFSNPVLFNNIFWNNDAFTVDQFSPGATLVDQGFIDYEIRGTTNNNDTFTPRFSDNTNDQILGPNGVLHGLPAGQGNHGAPELRRPVRAVLGVAGSRLDPQQVSVTITGQDPMSASPATTTSCCRPGPPPARAATASQVIDRGARCSNTPVPANIIACSGTGMIAAPGEDFDNQSRPVLMTLRLNTQWDIGADESTLAP